MGGTFLVIDDTPDNLISMKAILEDVFPDSRIFTADSGAGGLDVARAENPDVILLDILMPEMDGFEVCSILKNDDVLSDIPVIILTALQETRENRMQALQAGAEAFLSKPVDTLELTAQLRAMMKIREANRSKRSEKELLSRMVREKTRDLENSQSALLNLLDDLKAENKARKEKEEELEENRLLLTTIMDNLPIGIAVSTLDTGISFDYMNDVFPAMFKTDREHIKDGRFWEELFTEPDRREKARQTLIEDMRSGDLSRMYWQNIPIEKGGAITYVDAKNVPIRGKNLFVSTVWDVTDRILAQEQTIRNLEHVRRTLSSFVQAMSTTVETRDPYTAGHQRRVADLARAIAIEMKMSADEIEGLYLAAQIHDIGKISIPAELLSMPRKLTDIEFALMKTHSQSGFDILKDIEFPWPIARIILEHHEKLNGSGYPLGKTGSSILPESRILAVADVVEAVASHRPYRAALGIQVAMNEIEKNVNIYYDADVVEACLTLFRKRTYELAV